MGTCRNDEDPNPGRLPQTEWEVLDQRKSIPADLQSRIGAPTSVIRVPMSVHEKISTKHANVLADYSMLGQHLETWQAYRTVNHRWEIYMPERDDGDRLMAIIGMDKTGSINLVSLYLVRRRNWKNRPLIPRKIGG